MNGEIFEKLYSRKNLKRKYCTELLSSIVCSVRTKSNRLWFWNSVTNHPASSRTLATSAIINKRVYSYYPWHPIMFLCLRSIKLCMLHVYKIKYWLNYICTGSERVAFLCFHFIAALRQLHLVLKWKTNFNLKNNFFFNSKTLSNLHSRPSRYISKEHLNCNFKKSVTR